MIASGTFRAAGKGGGGGGGMILLFSLCFTASHSWRDGKGWGGFLTWGLLVPFFLFDRGGELGFVSFGWELMNAACSRSIKYISWKSIWPLPLSSGCRPSLMKLVMCKGMAGSSGSILGEEQVCLCHMWLMSVKSRCDQGSFPVHASHTRQQKE